VLVGDAEEGQAVDQQLDVDRVDVRADRAVRPAAFEDLGDQIEEGRPALPDVRGTAQVGAARQVLADDEPDVLGVAVVVVERGLGQPAEGRQRFEPVDVEGVAEALSSIGTTFTVFALSFATSKTYGNGISTTLMLWVAIVANLVAAVVIPFFGALSDRIGRKPVFLAGDVLCAVLVVAFPWSISTGNQALVVATGVLLISAAAVASMRETHKVPLNDLGRRDAVGV